MLRLANMLYMPHHHTEEFDQEIRALFLDSSHRPDNQKWHCKSRPKSLHDVVSSQILTLATFVLLRSSSMAWQAIYMML